MTQEEAIIIAKKYKEMVAEKLPLKALIFMVLIVKGIIERTAILT